VEPNHVVRKKNVKKPKEMFINEETVSNADILKHGMSYIKLK